MTALATDNFNRANEDPISTNWTDGVADGEIRLVGNQIAGNAPASAVSYAWYDAVSFPNNQYSQIVVAALGTNRDWGPAVRCSAGTNFYAADFFNGSEQLLKFVSGSYTQLASLTAGLAVNDTTYIEAQGTTILAKRNGSTVGSVTDASLGSGAAGVFIYDTDARGDDWEGGDFGAAAASLPPPSRLMQHALLAR